MKKIKLTAILVVVSLFLNSGVVSATGGLQDKINQNNENIEKLEKEKNEVNQQNQSANKDLAGVLSKVDAKNKELEESNKKVEAFQGKIDELQGKIDEVQKNINDMDKEIKSKENLINKKEEESKEIEEILGLRLRNYYKNDMTLEMLRILLSSDGFGDLIGNINIVSKIIKMDNELLDEIKNLQVQLDKDKVSLQEEVDKLYEEEKSIKVKQQELVEAQKSFIEEKKIYENQMQQLKSLENEKQRVVNSLSQKEKELQDKIGDLNSYNKSIQEQIDNLFNGINNGSNVDGGISNGEGFLKPANGGISSPYGKRVHPVTGANGFHTGIDIAAPNNDPILAAKSGKVVFAGVQSGYGNVVIVDHGGGIQTLYAHCNKFLVSYGQTVKRGEKIALVGSTGMSTGPHLHFEVRVNGKHTNPMNYLN